MAGLKIIQVIPNLRKGGAERLVVDICNALQSKENIQIKLVIFEDINDYKHLTEKIDIEICRVRMNPSIIKKSDIDISNFDKIIAEFKPNIIHSHLFAAEIVSRWKIYPNIKYFTHCHDNMAQFKNLSLNGLKKVTITNFFEKQLLLQKYKISNTQFITISKDSLRYFQKNLAKSFFKNILLLHNAINVKAFFNADQKRINKKAIQLINVGSLVDKKNQLFLVEVVHHLKTKGYHVNLQLLGEGIMRSKIENRIRELKLMEAIHLIGNVNHVEDYLKAADVYLHSAYYEPFGLVILEAMAAGLPVVCLDGGGNRDLIEQGVNGFMIYENKVEAFSQKIIDLIESPPLYETLSNHALTCAKKYDLGLYIEKLLKLYEAKIEN